MIINLKMKVKILVEMPKLLLFKRSVIHFQMAAWMLVINELKLKKCQIFWHQDLPLLPVSLFTSQFYLYFY